MPLVTRPSSIPYYICWYNRRDMIMKICGLITAISVGILPACATQVLHLSSNTSTPSALELPIPTYCNASASWLPPGLSANDLYNDCYRVTLQLLRIVHDRGRETYEFHAAGVQPSHGGIHAETTPLKFTYSTHLVNSRFQ